MQKQNLKNVAFRVDASINIGSGHLMRCLTLADKLSKSGIKCIFLSRNLKGHMIEIIKNKGHEVIVLYSSKNKIKNNKYISDEILENLNQKDDAMECCFYLKETMDWIVVDHYSLDSEWENLMIEKTRFIMAIDDIANRFHFCNIILDQNFVLNYNNRYDNLVSDACVKLLGPKYALVRPDFPKLRDISLSKRKNPEINRILVFMSGGDNYNETEKVIEGIKLSKYWMVYIDIVVTLNYPFMESLIIKIKELPNAKIYTQTDKMAYLMASADIAFTAGGSVTWEKCVLGLPSIVSIMADNQKDIALEMNRYKIQKTIGFAAKLKAEDYSTSINSLSKQDLKIMSNSAIDICDGTGIDYVVEKMKDLS